MADKNHGRTLKLTPAIEDELCEAVRAGLPFETACTMLGISYSTVKEWLQIGSGSKDQWADGNPVAEATKARLVAFSARIARARAEREGEAVHNIRKAAQTVGKSGVPEWRASAWYLEHHPNTRDRWGQRVQLDINQDHLTPEERRIHEIVRVMSPEELLALGEALEDDEQKALPGGHHSDLAD